MCISGSIAAGEINTNLMVLVTLEHVNGGLCTKFGLSTTQNFTLQEPGEVI